MDLDTARKLIEKYVPQHQDFIIRAAVADRYYDVKNDIIYRKKKKDEDVKNPMRSADNRIPHSFYQLLVNQKTAYMFTVPPTFDVKSDAANKMITNALGDSYQKNAKDLCVEASNTGIAWVHFWDDDGFAWGVIPSAQIIPLWSPKIDHKLMAVLRVYKDYNDDGKAYDIYEYWDDKQCQAFKKAAADDYDMLAPYFCFTDFYNAGLSEEANIYNHSFGRVPFIPFRNNARCSNDLSTVKALIDSYDKTYSGFLNDLEDVQEVIFILTNYGGTGDDEGLSKFLKDLKYYKTICTENAGSDDKSGVSTLTIDIPVDARSKMLEITRKSIFDMGQGIDPQQQGLDATSGEAMKFLYALLELKAGMMETEFHLGFNELIRAILQYSNIKIDGQIIQTWTRTSIRNDSELVDMCSKSDGIISKKTILKNHPFVENAEDEEKQIKAEEKERMDEGDDLKSDIEKLNNKDDPDKGGEDDV